MFTEDYILRLIRQATSALATILGLAKTGQIPAALHILDQTLEALVGLDVGLVKAMDDQSLLNLLTAQDEMQRERLVVTADLFKAEGDLLLAQQRSPQSLESYARALTLYLEAAQQDPTGPKAEVVAKIEALHQQSAEAPWPIETLFRLQAFYTRLLDMDQAGRPNPVVTPAELEKRLHEIEQRLLAFQ